MDFFLDPEFLALREQLRSWLEKHPFPAAEEIADPDARAREIVRRLGERGFLAYVVPKSFAGARPRILACDLCLIREELAGVSALADTLFGVQALGSYPIALAGTDRQKAEYLPPIAGGKALAAFALTESQAGSDVSSIETRAVRHGKEYCMSGTKCFVSNAGLAQTYVVFASTAPERKKKGISAFVVEAGTPGIFLGERTTLLSPHPIGIVAFEECLIPEAQLLGREGEGYDLALKTLGLMRCTVGAAAVGMAQRAADEALHHSTNRRQFGQPLAGFQAIQFKLADMATELDAARLLVYQAAWMKDHDQEGFVEKSSMAKLFATEAAQRIVDASLQIHGGIGVIVGHPLEQLYRDVRALRIYEGTSEIQKLIIARSLLRRGKTTNE